MSVGGIIQRTNKPTPPTVLPPFPASSANNGLSVSGVGGFIVLGQDIGAVGNPAILLNNREIPLANFTINLNADAAQSNDMFVTKNSAAAIRARITKDGSFSNTGGQTNSEIFGDGAIAGGSGCVVIGKLATSGAGNSVVIGSQSNGGNAANIVIGQGSSIANGIAGITILGNSCSQTTSGNATLIGGGIISTGRSTVIGRDSTAAGSNNFGIGESSHVGHDYSGAMGFTATTTATNQLVVGGSVPGQDFSIRHIFFGSGVTSPAPQDVDINTGGASGANVAGGNMTLASGRSTGNAASTFVFIKCPTPAASSSTLQTLNSWASFTKGGVVIGDIDGIGNATKLSIDDNTQSVSIDVGGTNYFKIDLVNDRYNLGNSAAGDTWIKIFNDVTSKYIDIFAQEAGGAKNCELLIQGITEQAELLAVNGFKITGDTTLLHTGTSLADGAGAAVGTLTNAPAAGNPTKWIPIDDNGTTRYIPAW